SFSHDSPPTIFYTLSLHDALPISDAHDQTIHQVDIRFLIRDSLAFRSDRNCALLNVPACFIISISKFEQLQQLADPNLSVLPFRDRKSTRLNSSHRTISYAVFCLK